MTDQPIRQDAAGPERSATTIDPGRVLLEWRSHPVRQGGRRRVIAIAALTGAPALLWSIYGPFFAVMGFLILGASLGAYFLPTAYVFYEGGIESVFLGVRRRFVWGQFRSFYRDRNGVLLSPFPRPSRLENFRGVYLRFDGQADKVMAVIAERVRMSADGTAGGDGA